MKNHSLNKLCILFSCLILTIFNSNAEAATKKKKKATDKSATVTANEDQVYTVPEIKSEILILNQAPPIKKLSEIRPQHLFYVGLTRGSLTYKLPSLLMGDNRFSPNLVGINIGNKTGNELYLYKGYYEISGEWQGFKRESGIFSQKINVFQINLIQNVNLAWSFRNSLFFSAGLGVAPVYLTAEQSVFGNSVSHFGAMGLLKADFIFPLKKNIEVDLGMRGGWGSVGGREIFMSNLNLGLNFE